MPADSIYLKPFPPLPLELKGEILSHCDADTLAKASSASLAFLELASPLLYRHITFVGPESLKKFLSFKISPRIPADIQVPALAPYLDLSLVESITYISVEGDHFPPGINKFDVYVVFPEEDGDVAGLFFEAHRLLPPGATVGAPFVPLPVQSLHAKLIGGDVSDPWLFFDPVVARIEGTPAGSAKEATVFYGPDLSRWTRLQELSLVDAVTEGLLFHEGLPAGPVGLRYELSVVDKGASTVTVVVEDAHGLDDDDSDLSSISQIIIQVATEAMRTAFLDRLVSSPLLDRTTVVVKPDPAAEASPAASTTSSI